MRESNFSNPFQNKACVCISAAIYDRRALDCTATLPLINSLNHLAYLTSTSPRIREMVCLDGGLERLIRILRQVPRSPSQPPMRGVITKEMQAVWKWSLAFQCVVNIGVRGSETVRTRVVQAGMVPVAVRVLESYLRIADAIRDERKREARREEAKQRLERSAESGVPLLALGAEVATPTAATTTVARRAMREISGTADPAQQLAHSDRPDQQQPQHLQHASPWRPTHSETVDVSMSNDATGPIATAAVDISDATQRDETRPTTPAEGIISNYIMSDSSSSAIPLAQGASTPSAVENEEDVASLIAPIDRLAEVDNGAVSPSSSSSSVVGARGRHGRGSADNRSTQERGAYSARLLNNVSSIEDLTTSGSGSDGADDVEAAGGDDSDSGNAISRNRTGGASSEVGMEEIEDRTTPRPPRRPLAPAAVTESTRASTASSGVTPSAMHEARSRPALPFSRPVVHARSDPVDATNTANTSTHATRPLDQARTPRNAVMPAITAARPEAGHAGTTTAPFGQRSHHAGSHGAVERTRAERERDSSSNQIHPSDMIYREEEVLLSLQLLAYLSKYAHVRTLFHRDLSTLNMLDPLQALDGRAANAASSVSWSPNDPPKKNVFCIAERYTLRSSRTGLSHFASMGESRIAPEIQYWAGVIMRNACRKDEKQGGIRQCANMLCGKWEKQPREFAKCRRCRKAKYCSKQCQSKGWQMGHRFWCSARSDDEPGEGSKERVKDQPAGTTDAAHGQNALLTEDETQQTGGEDEIGTGGENDAHSHHHNDHRHHHHHHHHHQGTTHAASQRAASADSGSRRLERSQQLQHATQTSDHSDPITSDASGAGSAFMLTSDAEGDTTLRSRMMGESSQRRFGRSVQEDATAVGPSNRQQNGPATAMPSASGSSAHRGPGGGYGALARSVGPSGPSIGAGRRAVSAIPQHLQLPSSQHHGQFGDHHDGFNRSRTVSAASSSADISDMSEDEMERASRRVLASTVAPAQRSPAGTTLTLSAHAHAANDVTRHGDDLVRRRVLGNGEDSVAVGGVPTRTDLAGRPLPPPVIARHDGPGANMDMGMTPDADLLTLDGRLTPAVTDDADTGVFGRGDFDQMIWRGRTPSLEDNQQAAMLRRVPRIEVGSQHSLSTSTSREDLLQDSRGHASRDATDDEQQDASLSASSSSMNVAQTSSGATSASAYGTSPSMLNSALLLANQEDLGTPRFPSAGLHAPVARPAHRFASVNAASSAMSSSIAHSAAMSISGTPMTVSPANAPPHQSYNHHQRGGLMHTFGDWRARVASPAVLTTSQPLSTHAANADGSSLQAYQGAGSSRSSTASSSSMLASAPATSSLSFGVMQQQPIQSAQGASISSANAEGEQFVVPNEIQDLFDEVEMHSTTRQRTPLYATSTAADMEVDT